MLDRVTYGLSAEAAGDASIAPFAHSLEYPGGRADIWLTRLSEPARDLSPARAALAHRLVAWRAHCEESGVALAHDADGAPRLVAPDVALALSLAGRGDIVAAAVADGPVGVDIETLGEAFSPPLNVLHPTERAALAAASDAHGLFLRIWTAKEAYLKALGTGLLREPAGIEVRLAASDATFAECPAFDIVDRGRRVATRLARAGRTDLAPAPVVLACVVLER